MGYYIRVLGKNLATIPVQELQEVALPAVVDATEGSGDPWEQLTLKHKSGQEIAVVERNPVAEGKLGADELQEFLDEVPYHKPESAAAWLQKYLPTVKVIYALQLLGGTDVDDGWTPLHRLYRAIWSHAGGILQADGEGFSNEEGYTVTPGLLGAGYFIPIFGVPLLLVTHVLVFRLLMRKEAAAPSRVVRDAA